MFCSMGKFIGLAPKNQPAFKISKVYFRCEMEIPFFDRETSMPRKYFKSPNLYFKNDRLEIA